MQSSQSSPEPDPRGRLDPPDRRPPTAVGAAAPMPEAQEPLHVATAFLQELERGDWQAAAARIAPPDAEEFRNRVLQALLDDQEQKRSGRGRLRRELPPFRPGPPPRTPAPDPERLRHAGTRRLRHIPGAPRLGEVAAWPAAQLLAHHLANMRRTPLGPVGAVLDIPLRGSFARRRGFVPVSYCVLSCERLSSRTAREPRNPFGRRAFTLNLTRERDTWYVQLAPYEHPWW